jgi:uroporphyrinogen-III synthase
MGYQVLAVPTVAVDQLHFQLPRLRDYDWIVAASAAALASFPSIERGPRWAVVGRSTARALKEKGVEAEFIPSQSNGAALASGLPDVEGQRVLLVQGSGADPALRNGLLGRGAVVQQLVTYKTIEGPEELRPALRAALAEGDIAAITFASGSAVRGFLRLGGVPDWPAITIGPRTSAAARRAGFQVIAEAVDPGVEEFAAVVRRALPLEVKERD